MRIHHAFVWFVSVGVFACGGPPTGARTPASEPDASSVVLVEQGAERLTLADVRVEVARLTEAATRAAALDALATQYGLVLEADASSVTPFVEEAVGPLVRAYDGAAPEQRGDVANLLELFADARALSVYRRELAWSEETAPRSISAARALTSVTVPEAQRADLVDALSAALRRVTGSRGLDNRRRIAFLRALGSLRDRRATPVLVEIALAQRDDQSFLINRLAVEQLARAADPAAIQPLIELLYHFDPQNPAMRTNDLAENALVSIGRPALPALYESLAGRNARANAICSDYIEAVRQVDTAAAERMTVSSLVAGEATYVLGGIGAPESFDVLLSETRSEEADRSINAAVALARLVLEEDRARQVREALERVYASPSSTEGHAREQLIGAIRALYDRETLPFLLAQASDASAPARLRMAAADAHALLAGRVAASSLRAMIRAEPEDTASLFANLDAPLDAAEECDMDLACWLTKLGTAAAATDYVSSATKAAYMVGMLGRGSPEAASALVAHLDDSDLRTRLAVLWALDHIAVEGSPEAVARVDALQSEGRGRASSRSFDAEALRVRARLITRAR